LAFALPELFPLPPHKFFVGARSDAHLIPDYRDSH